MIKYFLVIQDEKFFNANDVPDKAKLIVQEIKELVDVDTLNLRKKDFNLSSKYNVKEEIDFDRKLLNVTFLLR